MLTPKYLRAAIHPIYMATARFKILKNEERLAVSWHECFMG
jgi:hypothetical protein